MPSWVALETGPGSAEFLLLFLVYVLLFLLFYIGLPAVGVVIVAWQAPKIIFHRKGLRNRGWSLTFVFVAIGSWLLWFGASIFWVPLLSTEGLVWGVASLVEGIMLFALSTGMALNELRARKNPSFALKRRAESGQGPVEFAAQRERRGGENRKQ